MDAEALRAVFVRLLTIDNKNRREFNQAVFAPEGWPIWSRTDLSMVMEKFDRAVAECSQGE